MFLYQENANELKAPHLHSRIDAFSFRLYRSWWPVSGPGLESLLCGPGSLRQRGYGLKLRFSQILLGYIILGKLHKLSEPLKLELLAGCELPDLGTGN